jgi:hypothetical protein
MSLNRANIQPNGQIDVYKITSDQMKIFIAAKAAAMQPGTKVEMSVDYWEKKKSVPRRSYAMLKVAMSDDVIEKKEDNSWIIRMVDSESDIKFVKKIWDFIVRQYSYDKKELESMLNDYRKLDQLEESFGLTEDQIKQMMYYSVPRRIKTGTKDSWIVFAARPDAVIKNMLTDPTTNKVNGRMEIVDIVPITKDTVEYTVYVHVNEVESSENPEVRKLLQNDLKK